MESVYPACADYYTVINNMFYALLEKQFCVQFLHFNYQE